MYAMRYNHLNADPVGRSMKESQIKIQISSVYKTKGPRQCCWGISDFLNKKFCQGCENKSTVGLSTL